MQIVRVYTGADGESHFEDLTPEQFATMVNNLGEGPITLNCRPSPSFSDYHQAVQGGVNANRRRQARPAAGTAPTLEGVGSIPW